jgi:hypothetical protein
MKTNDFSNHSLRKQNIEYFIHVVRVAKADDVITDSEMNLLHQLGNKMGYTEPEIDTMILTTNKSDYIPPYELEQRFEQLYGIVQMTLADGVIDKNEMRIASSFAIKSGFSENEIPRLLVLLISGIKQGADEEILFSIYRKRAKSFQDDVINTI